MPTPKRHEDQCQQYLGGPCSCKEIQKERKRREQEIVVKKITCGDCGRLVRKQADGSYYHAPIRPGENPPKCRAHRTTLTETDVVLHYGARGGKRRRSRFPKCRRPELLIEDKQWWQGDLLVSKEWSGPRRLGPHTRYGVWLDSWNGHSWGERTFFADLPEDVQRQEEP